MLGYSQKSDFWTIFFPCFNLLSAKNFSNSETLQTAVQEYTLNFNKTEQNSPALSASPFPLSRRHLYEFFLMACPAPVFNSYPFQYQLYSAKTLSLISTLFRYNRIILCKKSVITSLLLSILKNTHLPLYHNLFAKVIFYFPLSFLRNLRKLFSLSLSFILIKSFLPSHSVWPSIKWFSPTVLYLDIFNYFVLFLSSSSSLLLLLT